MRNQKARNGARGRNLETVIYSHTKEKGERCSPPPHNFLLSRALNENDLDARVGIRKLQDAIDALNPPCDLRNLEKMGITILSRETIRFAATRSDLIKYAEQSTLQDILFNALPPTSLKPITLDTDGLIELGDKKNRTKTSIAIKLKDPNDLITQENADTTQLLSQLSEVPLYKIGTPAHISIAKFYNFVPHPNTFVDLEQYVPQQISFLRTTVIR